MPYKQRQSKYTYILLAPIIKSSFSVAEVMRKLGLASGGGHKVLRKLIKQGDVKHFTGQGWSRGKIYFRKSNEEIFTQNGTVNSWWIREALFKRGLKEKRCEKCNGTKWLEQAMPLEVHHKNGKEKDNRLMNLEILCLNCHALTDNFRTKNTQRAVAKQQTQSP